MSLVSLLVSAAWPVVVVLGALCLILNFLPWLLEQGVCSALFTTQDLKKRYNAKWALVTGGSSGIGKAIADRLASQGLNVVLVALEDKLFDPAVAELQRKHPSVQIRKVAANLGRPGYLETVASATKDIDVQCVFLNAGYIVTGMSWTIPIERHIENFECNAGSAFKLTHHFLARMTEKKLRGCFVFTSSAAACIPSPSSTGYAATKSFISMFALGLQAETKSLGIDVLVFQPSATATRFYDKAHKMSSLEWFRGQATPPEALIGPVFGAIGRVASRDLGAHGFMFRALQKLLDASFWFGQIASRAMPLTADYKLALTKQE